jgi:hypothetical protein
MKLLVPRRRLLKVAAAVIAMPYVKRVDAAAAFGGFMVAGGATAFPGQAGNRVGYNNEPSWPGSFMNGSLGLPSPVTFDAYITAIWGGTLPNNKTISYIDFIGDSNGGVVGKGQTYINNTGANGGGLVSNTTFKGCRFQSNATGPTAVNVNGIVGSTGTIYSYCSFVPVASLWAAPPLAAWPASSAGTGVTLGSGTYSNYVIPYSDGFQFGLAGANLCTLDHCDIWGGGNLIDLTASGTFVTITDCWVHDFRNYQPPNWNSGTNYTAQRSNVTSSNFDGVYLALATGTGAALGDPAGNANANWQQSGGPTSLTDHTDNIAYTAGGLAPTDITIRHNTVAGIGNTVLIGLQQSTSNFQRWTITNNYMSGNNQGFDAGGLGPGLNNITFTDNIIATDLPLGSQPVSHSSASTWRANGNTFARNKWKVFPGDTWSPANGNLYDGYYIWPDSSGPQALGPAQQLNLVDFS